MKRIDITEALEAVETRALKRIGSAMLERIESVKKYVENEIDVDITDYLIIKSSKECFQIDPNALNNLDDQQIAVSLAGIAGGICEMSAITVEVSRIVKEREGK